MFDVMVDGIRYVPAGSATFGVGITTRNRNKTLAECLTHWRQYTPADVPIVVVDDASDKPVDGADYRFEERAGVAAAKNKTLELLMAAGVDHLFLADDDIFPTVDDWWTPYLDSPEPHLMYVFGDLAVGRKLRDIRRLPADPDHAAWTGPRGCLLYAERRVVDTVGGMDAAAFPGWGYEHGDWSNRIHHAGFTTWRYADVTDSDRIWHSMDEHSEVERTVPTVERERRVRENVRIHHDRRDRWHTGFVEYRTGGDVVATTLFTGGEAKASGRAYKPDTRLLADLAASIRHGRLIVFHDELAAPAMTTGNGRPVEFIRTPSPDMNVFLYRHRVVWSWLRNHPEVARIWTVDGTDVKQQSDPFAGLEAGRLYLGWEPKTLSDPWMIEHHTEQRVAKFLTDHPDRTLLNAGLIGGDRPTMLRLLHRLFAYWFDVELAASPEHDDGDMGILQLAADGFDVVTGPAVATVFKTHTPNGFSWWQHK